MAKKQEDIQKRVFYKKFDEEEVNSLLVEAETGNLSAYFKIVMHNQQVIVQGLSDLMKEIRGIKQLDTTQEITLPKIKITEPTVTTPSAKPTIEAHQEKTAEALRRARGGGR